MVEDNILNNNNKDRKKIIKRSILSLVALILAIGGGLLTPTLP